MIKNTAVIFVAALFLSSQSHAAEDSLARYAASYMLISPSVRALGMGGAYAAAGQDAQSIYFNPAGLAAARKPEFGSMFAPQSNDETLWSLEYAQPLGAWGVAGVGFIMHQVTNIEGRASEFAVPFPIDSREGTALFSYGYAPNPKWSVGATFKYMFQSFTGLPDNAEGVAFDLGARYRFESVQGLTAGAALQNIAGRFRWSTGNVDPVLFIAKTGLAYPALPWLLTTADVDFRGDNAVRLHAGVEATYWLAALRAGVDETKPTFGVGLNTPDAKVQFRFDFAYEIDPTGLGDINRFGFTWRF